MFLSQFPFWQPRLTVTYCTCRTNSPHRLDAGCAMAKSSMKNRSAWLQTWCWVLRRACYVRQTQTCMNTYNEKNMICDGGTLIFVIPGLCEVWMLYICMYLFGVPFANLLSSHKKHAHAPDQVSKSVDHGLHWQVLEKSCVIPNCSNTWWKWHDFLGRPAPPPPPKKKNGKTYTIKYSNEGHILCVHIYIYTYIYI